MAQANMICPFSHKLCTDCAYYRGRHYFLCFCKEYRGYLGNSQKRGKKSIAQRQPPFAHSRLPEFEQLEKAARTMAKEKGTIAGV